MRQYGLDFARGRPGWRRWGWRRPRFPDLCTLLRQFYPEFDFFGFAECDPTGLRLPFGVRRLPFAPGPLPVFPEVPFSLVGLGCPGVLAQMGYTGQDGLAITQLALAGVPIPTAADPIRFGLQAGFILQLRFNPGDGVDVRRCNLGLDEVAGREVVAAWDALSDAELSAGGFT